MGFFVMKFYGDKIWWRYDILVDAKLWINWLLFYFKKWQSFFDINPIWLRRVMPWFHALAKVTKSVPWWPIRICLLTEDTWQWWFVFCFTHLLNAKIHELASWNVCASIYLMLDDVMKEDREFACDTLKVRNLRVSIGIISWISCLLK